MERDELKRAPLRIAPDTIAGRGLQEMPPLEARSVGNPRRILVPSERNPKMSVTFQGDIVTAVYESGPGKFELENNGYDEYIHVLDGKLILTARGGSPVEIEAGGHVIMPKGFSGTWEMLGETFRELVVMEYETWLADANAS